MSEIVVMRSAAEDNAIQARLKADFDRFWRNEPSIVGDVIAGKRYRLELTPPIGRNWVASTESGPYFSDSYATRVDDFSWSIPCLGGEDW